MNRSPFKTFPTFRMLPDEWAALCKSRVGQKYEPSNGTEGEIFHSGWCANCARYKAMSEGKPIEECDDDETCDILGRSFLGIDDPLYPVEWQYNKDGQPCCTAFVEVGQPIPPAPDVLTGDLFGEKPAAEEE